MTRADELIDAIRALRKGERRIVLHSSISGLGFHRDQGSDKQLARVLDNLATDQTILLPAFTFSAPKVGYYDDRSSLPETGKLGLIARDCCGFQRTPHRMFSYFVKGVDEDLFLDSRPDIAFGPGSAVERSMDAQTLVVMLAAPWSCCTTIHAVEESLAVPYREYKVFDYPAVIGGIQQPGTMTAFVRRPKPRTRLRFDRIRNLLVADGSLRQQAFSGITIEAASAADISRLAHEAITKAPFFFVDYLEM